MNKGEAPRDSSMEPGGAPSPPGASAQRSFLLNRFVSAMEPRGGAIPPHGLICR